MKRIESGDENILIYREPVYASWLISAPFYFGAVVVGCFVAIQIVEGLAGANIKAGLPALFGVLILGFLAFSLLVAAITTPFDWFSRRGCTVNREANTLRWEWGLFVPVLTQTVSLRVYDQLQVRGVRWVGERSISSKMNINLLGNLVPHLHAHLLPRYEGDPAPGRPIDPGQQVVMLTPDEYQERVRQIQAAL